MHHQNESRKPVWAYAIASNMQIADPPGPQPRPPQPNAQPKAGPVDTKLYTVPGSKFQFTMAQIRSTTELVTGFRTSTRRCRSSNMDVRQSRARVSRVTC